MAMTLKVDGLEEIGNMLSTLSDKAESVAAVGLYDGAGVMADEVSGAAGEIQTAPFHYAVFVTRDPSPEEKAVVLSGAPGIAKFQKNGSEVNTSVGYGNAGYAELNGKQVPIAKIANSINSGTSFMRKQPFFRKAVNSGKEKASEAIRNRIEKTIEELKK